MQNEHEPKIKDLLFLLTAGFVDHIQDVKVNVDKSARGFYITMKVNMADQRKVIGSGGKNSRAIQSVLEAFLAKHNENLERFHVLEPTVGQAMDSFSNFTDHDWNKEKSDAMAKLFQETLWFIDGKAEVTASDEVHGETRIRIQPAYEYGATLVTSLSDIFKASAKVRGRRIVLQFQDANEDSVVRNRALPH